MIESTLIDTACLATHLPDPAWAVVDCRFSLADSERGRRDYRAAHIPGAVYAHLDDDLSDPVRHGVSGRHPLPDATRLAETFSRWGIDDGVQVIVYDDAGGAIAARLWWLLGWLGHPAVAVLDGGWPRWLAEGRPVRETAARRAPRSFAPRPRPELVVNAPTVLATRGAPGIALLDARTRDRYCGENETIDPVAGHIPGALSAPYVDNLNPDGTFRSATALRARFRHLLGELPVDRAMIYCGSGVTAAHDLLAIAHAGLGEARLYAGSWSEWITDPTRPVATGDRP